MTNPALAWAGGELTGPEPTFVRTRPWAEVWRIEAVEGRWWLKINSAATAYEPHVLEVLSGSGTTLLPAVRTHPTQPWSLLADAGRSARDVLAAAPPEERIAFWSALLPAYAELQRSVDAAPLRAAGLPDLSAGSLLAVYDELVADGGWYVPAVAPELTADQWAQIRAAGPRLAAAAQRLAETRPPAIQHDDLHDGNVFVSDGRTMIIDWGDAVLAHPFGTLLVSLDVLAAQLDCSRDDPRLRPVAEGYLEVWRTGGESRAELDRELGLAVRTAALSRAAGWRRALGTPESGRELGFADAVAHWMTRVVV